MHTQGLGNAGAETVGLNQSSDQRANIFDPSAFGEVTERLDPRFSGARFQVEKMAKANYAVG